MTGDVRRSGYLDRARGTQEVRHVPIKEEDWKDASISQGLPRSSGN